MRGTRCPNEYDSLPQQVREQVQVGVRNDNFSMSYTVCMYLCMQMYVNELTFSCPDILETSRYNKLHGVDAKIHIAKYICIRATSKNGCPISKCPSI